MPDGSLEERAFCKICGADFSSKTSGGTGHLTRHAEKCTKKNEKGKTLQTQIQTQIAFSPQGHVTTWHFDPEIARENHAKFLAENNLSLSFGSNESWNEYITSTYCPQYKSVSRNTQRKDVIKVFNKLRVELIEVLSSINTSIACTSDIWEGRTKVGYIAITAHYIDKNWKLQKRLIGFREIQHPHMAENIFCVIMDVFELYGILGKVGSITFDNASNNTATIPMFRNRLNPPHGLDLFHQRCICHVINLIVQVGVKEIVEYVDNIRSALAFIMTGGKRRQDFNLMCESFGLPHKKFNLDVPHRWNSLYLMLESCLPYKDPLICYYNRNISDNIRPLDEIDFTMVKYFVEFLKPFYNATRALSGVYYSTSCMTLQQLYEISSTFEKFGNYPVFNEIVIKMIFF
jgi:hypothetical protein